MSVFLISSIVSAQPSKKPVQVWNLKIKGNQAFSDIIIKDQIMTSGFSFLQKLKFWSRSGHKLDKIELKKDVIRIQDYYKRRGFYNASAQYQISSAGKAWKKNVTFIVNEKAPIRIKNLSIDIQGNQKFADQIRQSSAFKRTARKSEYQEGGRYEVIKKPEINSNYLHVLKNLGYAYAQVNITADVDTANLAADVTINCNIGPKTYIDKVNVEGEKSISKDYVRRETGFKSQELFSVDALEEAQRQLFNHPLFKFATINIPDQPKDSSLVLDLQIRENDLRTVETSIGFGTADYVRGQVSWIHRNVFHKGHKFTVSAKGSFIEQRLNVDYLFPYVFNTKSSFIFSPFAQHLLEPSYEITRYGLTNSFIYRYSQNLTGTASYQLTRNLELSQQSNQSLPDTTQQYNLSSIQFSAYYNSELSNRNKGWVLQPFLEFSGSFGAASFRFQKLSLDVRRYTPITSTTTLATRVQVGGLFASSNDSLPNNVRYFQGGTNSVRGWGRDQLGPKRAITDSVETSGGSTVNDSTTFDHYIPTGGRTSMSFNLEIRQDIDALISGFGLDVFLDGGQIWQKGPDFEARPLQFALGGGVRYRSPIGPVRLDVGYKLNPSPADLDIYQGKDYGNFWNYIGIHVSVGQGF